jgi:hypothetical protein
VTLSDRFATAEPSRPGKPCSVSTLLGKLADDDAAALQAALDVPIGDRERLSSQQIASILRLEGHEIPIKSVENHRKGVCRCDSRRTPNK